MSKRPRTAFFVFILYFVVMSFYDIIILLLTNINFYDVFNYCFGFSGFVGDIYF